ncbi:DNA-directed RNA polymerase subunit delta [Desulfuribacillus alkaliarsenatis]|uniref:Probable DNA-directed RNA polymerase subunit delta n=1 Tax=Desulfuribacillus alkaliarsenatis TaxID=766136 RepID=A0A1E5G1I3_9FIRM|nr:DNA-directed RNA polymerase subunit delta [Desulfuribacillus alkaliarsenatis]OEF96755.1 DNA-directed RNA polymerase subunit delta [Desulfuribacillus alkaliarsenatis]
MSEQFSVQLTEEEIKNISYVDLAYEILNSSGNTFHYKDLLLEVGHRKGLSQDDLMEVMATIYSEINIDGRFLSIGSNVWGLKRWYPSEKTAKTGPTPKRFKRNDDDYDDYDLDDEFYMDDDYDNDLDDTDIDEQDDVDDVDVDEDIDIDIDDPVDDEFDIDDSLDEDIEEDDEDEDEGYDIADTEAEDEDDEDRL